MAIKLDKVLKAAVGKSYVPSNVAKQIKGMGLTPGKAVSDRQAKAVLSQLKSTQVVKTRATPYNILEKMKAEEVRAKQVATEAAKKMSLTDLREKMGEEAKKRVETAKLMSEIYERERRIDKAIKSPDGKLHHNAVTSALKSKVSAVSEERPIVSALGYMRKKKKESEDEDEDKNKNSPPPRQVIELQI